MITKEIINKVKEFAYLQTEEYSTPPIFQIDFGNEKAQELAEIFSANKGIVLIGTSLMDCMLGFALRQGKIEEHIKMSEEKAREFLSKFSEIEESERENILHCIREHHGVDKFYSIESEICCNADCYKFSSVKGVIGGMIYSREMSLEDKVKLFLKKADEKWNTLSLDICKKELEPEYKAIKTFLTQF